MAATGRHEVGGVDPGLGTCGVRGCDREGEPLEVVNDPDTGDVLREGVRCSDHAKDFLRVSS